MRFLVDEDVPRKLLTTLVHAGHDAIRVERSASDAAIALQAQHESRILITRDKDFTNTAFYPPRLLLRRHRRRGLLRRGAAPQPLQAFPHRPHRAH